MTPTEAAQQERDEIIIFIAKKLLATPWRDDLPRWQHVIWSMFHPAQFGEQCGAMKFANEAMWAIQNGAHKEK